MSAWVIQIEPGVGLGRIYCLWFGCIKLNIILKMLEIERNATTAGVGQVGGRVKAL